MARIAFVSDVVYPWVKGGMESIYYLEMKELDAFQTWLMLSDTARSSLIIKNDN